MRAIIVTVFCLFLSSLLGCEYSSAERKDQAKVIEQQEQYQVVQPLPRFDWSLERDVAIQLYKARNERVSTWTVWRSDTGIIEDFCPSIGYPLPYDTFLTNPLQALFCYSGGPIVEQPEPNGLYSSKNSIATWVRCLRTVNSKQIEAPIYIESKVTAYPYPVRVDFEKNRVIAVKNAAPTVVIEKNNPTSLPKSGKE